eukprot:CAMPEP_0182416332 /NCGR_PEP_ID=MMETSP1167-20130531/599_1 /TAXON_ID=2988 /ORGANISM="Mallomonas Sp, Strain CCMP3275" /LENGTH=246 /DNA_ID=CAMNT_0024588999 /DNA_START=145 /DNA_END=885 /DNA_ORIENTATION=-
MSALADTSDSSIRNDIVENYAKVNQRIRDVCASLNISREKVELVAVSKTKPTEDIMQLYNIGHRVFGENYAQELVEKAAQLPSDISWHFIGNLQSSKAKLLVRNVPNLKLIETVDTEKLATRLQNALAALDTPRVLDVSVQMNTSGEDTKSGISAAELAPLLLFIRDKCPLLRIAGLMTIGAPGDSSCFDRLVECRAEASRVLAVDPESLGLSMGMSGDFEEAIAHGATSVRVGSTIFGAREYPAK